MKHHRAITSLAIIYACLVGCAQTMRDQPTAQFLESQAVEAAQIYRIGPRDELTVTVWKQPELSVAELVVRLDGKISFPLLDDVQAAGLTPTELKTVLTERLDEYITAPHVTVVVRKINSKLVHVIGEVGVEGPQVYQAEMRIIDALSTARGFNEFAGRSRIKIIREQNGSGPIEFTFNYEEFVKGKNLEQNILLLPGDRIIVPPETPFAW